MSTDYLPIFVCDSRANNFDKYPQPSDLKIHYIIQRGAKINDLKEKLLSFLNSSTSNKVPVIKVSAGINDVLKLEKHQVGKVIVPSERSREDILTELQSLKTCVHSINPTAVVGFIVLAPASFKAFQREKTSRPVLSDEVLEQYQTSHNGLILEINSGIRQLNKEKQHQISPFTVDWATPIIKKHKRTRGRARKVKVVYSWKFDQLYDGLHAKSDLKTLWFNKLLTGFRADIDRLRPTIVDTEPSENESIDEDDRCWKRLRRE